MNPVSEWKIMSSWSSLISSSPKDISRTISKKVGPVISYKELVIFLKSLGVPLTENRMPKELSSSLTVRKDLSAEITVNKAHKVSRRKFAVAHELGHLLLHCNPGGEYFFSDSDFTSGNHAQQAQANLFARELLMPSDVVCDLIIKGVSFEEIADIFSMSTSAVTVWVGYLIESGIFRPGVNIPLA